MRMVAAYINVRDKGAVLPIQHPYPACCAASNSIFRLERVQSVIWKVGINEFLGAFGVQAVVELG